MAAAKMQINMPINKPVVDVRALYSMVVELEVPPVQQEKCKLQCTCAKHMDARRSGVWSRMREAHHFCCHQGCNGSNLAPDAIGSS